MNPHAPAEKKKLSFHSLMQNLVAGLTVSFVALSLGAAFGILSGRGAFAGMISAAIIALITSAFGGTRIQCSGPTGPMTAVSAVLVAFAHDGATSALSGMSPDHFVNLALFMNGIILLVMGILRLGKFITLVPNVVISGFMNGIALIIWLDQINRLFGLSGKTALQGAMSTNVIIVVVSAVLTFLLPVFFKKIMPKYASLISATLVTIIFMTIVSVVLKLNIETVTLSSSLHSFSDFTNLVKSQVPVGISFQAFKSAFPFALQLAILAYLDTLLTSLVIDKMTKEKTKQNKELGAQGLACAAAGFVGGIPGAQATIRSVLIIKEKASMRLAGILVGVFALIEMVLFQDYISLIPQAVFTGVLIKVGYDVFDWIPCRLYFKEWFRDRHEMLHNFFSRHDDEKIFVTNREMIFIVGTTLVTIVLDLNAAVGIFTVLFYFINKVAWKKNPMRDLKPMIESESFTTED